ncbi:MAG: hypothetical protein ABH869_01435 [Candidatus Omnitrophota bacterium]
MIKKTVKNMKNNIRSYVGRVFLRNMLLNLREQGEVFPQRKGEYYEWLHSDLVEIAEGFVSKNGIENTFFTRKMNVVFGTDDFDTFFKKFISVYLSILFEKLDDFSHYKRGQKLVLEDSPLNRFGAEKYFSKFGRLETVDWKKSQGAVSKGVGIILKNIIVLQISLSRGLKFSPKKKKYKVMREALWGLYDTGGEYFHDDFFVDNKTIKEEDVVFYSRGLSAESSRVKSYNDVKRSEYANFNIKELSIGINIFFGRIIPKYIVSASSALFRELKSPNYSLFSSMFLYFLRYALPYEKIFSNYEIGSELGHNFYSPGHVVEAIICRAYGSKYNLMHWSDTAIKTSKYGKAYLNCDNYFVWGLAHVTGVEGDKTTIKPTGYVFKRFVKSVARRRNEILNKMKVDKRGKIVSFLDESFRSRCKMTEEHYLNFWLTALNFARKNTNDTVLIKPKSIERYKDLSKERIKRFLKIKTELASFENVHILDDRKWSFIEVIGVSDIVITQGMCSSATIAIICGIEGLYLDEARYNHPFRELFTDRIVFNDSEKLLNMVERIIANEDSPIKDIPERLLRSFDTFEDDRGIDMFRSVLAGETETVKCVKEKIYK